MQSALVYPAVIGVFTLTVVALLSGYIFPKILPIFKSMNLKLPFSTRALIFINDLVADKGQLLLIAVVLLIIVIILLYKKSVWFRRVLQGFTLKLPILGPVLKNYHSANFCRTLGLLLSGGMPLAKALNVASGSSANVLYHQFFREVSESFSNEGGKVSKYLGKHPALFSDISSSLIATSEIAGNLPETLLNLAEMHQEELEDKVRNLSSLIEPALMIFLGLLIGFVAVSMITPIYEVTQNIHR